MSPDRRWLRLCGFRSGAAIQAAHDRADAAAQALFDKESKIDQLEVSISVAEIDLEQIEGDAEREGLEYQAVRQFVGAGPSSFPLLIDLDDANDSLSAGVYSSVASETANVDLDDFDAVMTEVEELRDSLESQRVDAAQATQTHAVLQETAEDEVELLGEIEAQRLQGEAVQHELDEQQRQREERERLEREATDGAAAAAQAAAAPAPVATPAAEPGQQQLLPNRLLRPNRDSPTIRLLQPPTRPQPHRHPRPHRRHRLRHPTTPAAIWRARLPGRVPSRTPGARHDLVGAATRAST